MKAWARWAAAVACLLLVTGPSAEAVTKRYVGRGYFDERYSGVQAAIWSGSSLRIIRQGVSNWVSTCFARDSQGNCKDWLQTGMRMRKGYASLQSYYEYQKGGVYQLHEWQSHGWRKSANYQVSHNDGEPGLWEVRKDGALVLGIGTWPALTEAQAYSEATNDGGTNEMYALFTSASYRDEWGLWRNFAPGDGGTWDCEFPYGLRIIYEHFTFETYGPQSQTCSPPTD